MKLEERDIPIIVEKGFQLAADLLSPDSIYSISVHQKNKEYGNFIWDKGKVNLKTSKGQIHVNPDKITEQGVAVCKATDGDLFFAEGGRKGIAMEITPDMCKPRGEYMGSLHTHPGGNPNPSGGDLGASTRNGDKIMCIASRTKEHEVGVNCYIPKTDFFPEEVMEIDSRIRDVLFNNRAGELNIEFKPDIHTVDILKKMGIRVENELAKVPVFDAQNTKWFASSHLDEVRDYYDVRAFRRQI